MRTVILTAGLIALLFPAAVHAQTRIDTDGTVFDGDYAIVGVGAAISPDYEGSNDSQVLPLLGATGEVGGIGFTIRGPSLSLDLLSFDVSEKVSVTIGPQARYRANRTGSVKDEVVDKLERLDGVIEAGGRVGVRFQEVFSVADALSMGVSARWDASGKGSGYIITPSMTYRLPVSKAQAVGVLVSTEYISGDYADYNYNVSQAGSLASGLPVYDAKGGFKEITLGIGTVRDLSGNGLDGGFAIGGGISYTRLFGSAAKTPITSLRGSRDQWFFGAGLGYTF
ncbi:MAG TPA: MipA/OmpV family protein [Novosphingobium sp.]|nr:MipA/OmpV family protein [Novosphingobium sp.]